MKKKIRVTTFNRGPYSGQCPKRSCCECTVTEAMRMAAKENNVRVTHKCAGIRFLKIANTVFLLEGEKENINAALNCYTKETGINFPFKVCIFQPKEKK